MSAAYPPGPLNSVIARRVYTALSADLPDKCMFELGITGGHDYIDWHNDDTSVPSIRIRFFGISSRMLWVDIVESLCPNAVLVERKDFSSPVESEIKALIATARDVRIAQLRYVGDKRKRHHTLAMEAARMVADELPRLGVPNRSTELKLPVNQGESACICWLGTVAGISNIYIAFKAAENSAFLVTFLEEFDVKIHMQLPFHAALRPMDMSMIKNVLCKMHACHQASFVKEARGSCPEAMSTLWDAADTFFQVLSEAYGQGSVAKICKDRLFVDLEHTAVWTNVTPGGGDDIAISVGFEGSDNSKCRIIATTVSATKSTTSAAHALSYSLPLSKQDAFQAAGKIAELPSCIMPRAAAAAAEPTAESRKCYGTRTKK